MTNPVIQIDRVVLRVAWFIIGSMLLIDSVRDCMYNSCLVVHDDVVFVSFLSSIIVEVMSDITAALFVFWILATIWFIRDGIKRRFEKGKTDAS